MSAETEEATKLEGTALFNEVINSDLAALQERIDLGAPINFLGTCGEAPLHIAIYKRDDVMIRMLLDAGADIMFRNSNLDTALHVAARMGLSRVIEFLYNGASALNKKRLFLNAKNKDGLTALHIACMPVMHWELDLTRLYRSWDSKKDPSLDNEEFPLKHGRIECRNFLKDRMQEDIRNKEVGSVDEMVAQNLDFSRSAGILRGSSSSQIGARIYYSALDYPAKLDANAWSESDKKFFLEYLPGVREVMTKLHTADVVGKTSGSGIANAALLQRQHELSLAGTSGGNNNTSGDINNPQNGSRGLLRGNLECEPRGIGRVDEGIYRAPLPLPKPIPLLPLPNQLDNVEHGKVEGEGKQEKEDATGMDGSMVYDLSRSVQGQEGQGQGQSSSDRGYRLHGLEVDGRPSGSASILKSIEEQADAAVAEMQRICDVELAAERERVAREKADYKSQMRPTGG